MFEVVSIRELLTSDLASVLALNNAAVPAVNELDEPALGELVDHSAVSLVAEVDGAFAGFCVVLPPGLAYDSLNYRWFSARYDDFAYLDRIAVAPEFRRFGLGRAMYAELVRRLSGQVPVLLCEVNLRPRNDVSLTFHATLGFREVGQQDTSGGTKTVSLLELDLASAAIL